MYNTPLLNLSYIAPSQAQKHVTINETIRALDALVQISIISREQTSTPQNPSEADRYLVTATPEGEWSTQALKLAAFQDNAWTYYQPKDGWLIWISDEEKLIAYNNNEWKEVGNQELPEILQAQQLGINTIPDANNKVAIKSDNLLLSHDDVTPGSGDIQVKINKSDTLKNASILYQTNYSGRAEIGLSGSDNFQFKVSSDGATFLNAIEIDKDTAHVTLPNTPMAAAKFNLLKDGGRFAGTPEPSSAFVSTFYPPSYIVSANGSTFSEGPKFIYNNNDNGGNAGNLSPELVGLIEKIKQPNFRRYGVEFYTLEITAGTQTNYSALSHNNIDHFLAIQNPFVPIPSELSIHWHMKVVSGSVILQDLPSSQILIDGTPTSGNQHLNSTDGWKQITRLYSVNQEKFNGYDPVIHRLYAAPSSVILMAAPIITPGLLKLKAGEILGLIPSLDAW